MKELTLSKKSYSQIDFANSAGGTGGPFTIDWNISSGGSGGGGGGTTTTFGNNSTITGISITNKGAGYSSHNNTISIPKLKIFAGIGSRETPPEVCREITKLAKMMAEKGWILRSGGAEGADQAFEAGYEGYDALKEISLPWKGFCGNKSPHFGISEEAILIAAKHHPAWNKVSVKESWVKLLARDSYQVLGADLKTPCTKLICWTVNGEEKGGTAQAMRIARAYNIPIINLFNIKTTS